MVVKLSANTLSWSQEFAVRPRLPAARHPVRPPVPAAGLSGWLSSG